VTKVYLGLGGNLGDTAQIFADALDHFEAEKWFVVRRVSSLWRSPAWGFEGPDFLNAVAEIETTAEPQTLLKALLHYELQCGRQRGPSMGSRPIDLDLLTWGSEIISEPGLTLPHPATPKRRFVLEPLSELESNLTQPGLGRISEHLAAARVADPEVWLHAGFRR
jgi:2-amino-4-hydroxy-6-hydroxymethyldihydropteridine diphosphokinase